MSERAKLIRLPNGDWIAPETVTAIKAFPPDRIGPYRVLARLVVVAGRTHHEMNFPGMDEARAYADELAAKVNNA